MNTTKIISPGYNTRIEEVLSLSWKIFKSQFLHSKQDYIKTEAPFQHHFAQIIKSVGDLYCINNDDLFKVHLEKKESGIRGKTKYFDIACEFYQKINSVIELKFKLKTQGAQKYLRIDTYYDIQSLELVVPKKFNLGKFYLITDDATYTRVSKGTGELLPIHQGAIISPGIFKCKTDNSRDDAEIELKNSYEFTWEQFENWYFLEITVK